METILPRGVAGARCSFMYKIYHYIETCINVAQGTCKIAVYPKIDIIAGLAYWNTEFSKLLSARV